MSFLKNAGLMLAFITLNLAIVVAAEAVCCRGVGKFGPIGFADIIGGVLYLPDGRAVPAELTVSVEDNPPVTVCSYSGDPKDSPCDTAGTNLSHADGEPYYNVGLSELIPDLATDDELESITVTFFARYTDPDTGETFTGFDSMILYTDAFGHNREARIDLKLQPSEVDKTLNQSNMWSQQDGVVFTSEGLVPSSEIDIYNQLDFDVQESTGSNVPTGSTFAQMTPSRTFDDFNSLQSDALCVRLDAQDDNNCACGQGNACRTLTYALSQAESGDAIWVSEGVHTRPFFPVLEDNYSGFNLNKGVTIVGGWDSTFSVNDPEQHETILSGLGGERIVSVSHSAEDHPVQLLNLTLSNGNAFGEVENFYFADSGYDSTDLNFADYNNDSYQGFGGALVLEQGQLILGNIVFDGNTANAGGCVAAAGGEIAIFDSLFSNCYSDAFGGALLIEGDATIENTVFTGNKSGRGGAIFVSGSLVMTDVMIADNVANFHGGGLYLSSGSIKMTRTDITKNETIGGNGAGIFMTEAAQAALNKTLIGENRASQKGGGIYMQGASLDLNEVLIERNTAWRVAGLGVHESDTYSFDIKADQVTIAGNEALDAYVAAFFPSEYSNVDLANITIAGNRALSHAGLGLTNADEAKLRNVLIKENEAISGSYAGFYAANSSGQASQLTVKNNRSHGTGATVSILKGNNGSGAWVIEDSIIADNVDAGQILTRTRSAVGLYAENIDIVLNRVEITGNQVSPDAVAPIVAGILLTGTHDIYHGGPLATFDNVLVADNHSPNDVAGVAVNFAKHRVYDSSIENRIANLIVTNNQGAGPAVWIQGLYNYIDGIKVKNNRYAGDLVHIDGSLDLDRGVLQSNTTLSATHAALIVNTEAITDWGGGSPNYIRNVLIAENGVEAAIKIANNSNSYIPTHISYVTLLGLGAGKYGIVSDFDFGSDYPEQILANSIIEGFDVGVSSSDTLIEGVVFWDNGQDLSDNTSFISLSSKRCDVPFVSPLDGDYRLAIDPSPIPCAIDQAIPMEEFNYYGSGDYSEAVLDFEGEIRPAGGASDIGADEFGSVQPLGDLRARSSSIYPSNGQMDWGVLAISADLPSKTDASVLLYTGEVNSDPIAVYPLVDQTNVLDLSGLATADYPSLQIEIQFGLDDPAHSLRPSISDISFIVSDDQSSMPSYADFHVVAGTVYIGPYQPISDALVALECGGQEVARTSTDSFGKYQFNYLVPDTNELCRIRVSLIDGREATPRIRYIYAPLGESPYLLSGLFQYNRSQILIPQDHDFDFAKELDYAAQDSNIDDAEHLADMAYSFVDMMVAADFASDVLMEDLPTADIHIFADSTDVYYNEEAKNIVIGERHSSADNANRPMNREWHEYMHFVHDHVTDFPEAICGHNHGGFSNCDTADSLIEGFAVFMSSVIADQSGKVRPELYWMGADSHAAPISLEINWPVWQKACQQDWCPWREEFAFAGTLWDLYDPVSSDDQIDLTLLALWSVLKKPDIEVGLDLYLSLQEAGVGQTTINYQGCEITYLDEIFVTHGIFDDSANGNQEFDCDSDGNHEEIGRAADVGRPDRAAVPFSPQYIEVNSSGVEVGEHAVWISVVFPHTPSQNYAYETIAVDGKVVVEPLPEGLAAQIKVTVEDDETTSANPLLIDNAVLLDALENAPSEESVIITHDFELAERPEPVTKTIEIVMEQGWMLISVPLILDDHSPAAIFAPIDGMYDLVYTYNGCNAADPWQKYKPDGSPSRNDLDTISHTQGIWVYMNQPATLTISGAEPTDQMMYLCPGSNLVSYPLETSQTVVSALDGIMSEVSVVYGYATADPTGDVWKRYKPDGSSNRNDLDTFEPNSGYWITVDQYVTWTPAD